MKRIAALTAAAAAVLAGFAVVPATASADVDAIDVLPISGGAKWDFHDGAGMQVTRDLLLDTDNFGATGTVPRDIVIHDAVAAAALTPDDLAGIDIVAAVLVTDVWPQGSLDTLDAFVAGGGALLVTEEGPTSDALSEHFGLTVGPGAQQSPGVDPAFTGTVLPPGTHPVVNGPFGTIETFEQFANVTWYTDLGPDAVALATSDAYLNPFSGPVGSEPGTAYAVINPGQLGPDSGPVAIVSDTDTFSAAYPCTPGFSADPCRLGGAVSRPELLLNTFAWLADPPADEPDVNDVPVVTAAAFTTAGSACPASPTTPNATLTGTWSDADADTWTVEIDWDPGATFAADVTQSGLTTQSFTASTVFATAGVHSATVRVSDAAAMSAEFPATTSLRVLYQMSGLLSPFNADGSSIWKYGSTAPVKVRITDCAGTPVSGLAPTVATQLISSSTPPASVDEAASTSSSDVGSTMRYDAAAGQYVFNFATKSVADGDASYLVIVRQAASLGQGPTGSATSGQSAQKFALRRK